MDIKKFFDGKCPFTGDDCDTFECDKCPMEPSWRTKLAKEHLHMTWLCVYLRREQAELILRYLKKQENLPEEVKDLLFQLKDLLELE